MVRVAWAGRVMTITLDRPERRNAVDLATLSGLGEAIDEAAAGGPDERARAIVLTGAPPAFSAGADLGGVEEVGVRRGARRRPPTPGERCRSR